MQNRSTLIGRNWALAAVPCRRAKDRWVLPVLPAISHRKACCCRRSVRQSPSRSSVGRAGAILALVPVGR